MNEYFQSARLQPVSLCAVSYMDGQNNYIAAERRNGSIWDSIPVTHLQSGPYYWSFTSTHMSLFSSYLNKKQSSI